MEHPYVNLSDYQNWFKSISWSAPGHVDVVVESRMKISVTEKVSTMGSCFAQNISRTIKSSGFNYFIPEQKPSEMNFEEGVDSNYGVFSARYGNVYTTRQALQLFERAFSIRTFESNIWQLDKNFVDAYRPRIQPSGYTSVDELLHDREQHLHFVRKVFTESDCFIFTLGLTESWVSRIDDAVFPIAPGVCGGNYNEKDIKFVNFDCEEVTKDLFSFITHIREINNQIKIILTVSPIPLVATYENRHVLVSSTYSKSVLRVAAEEASNNFDNVVYFPSFEIINSPSNENRYLEDDLRGVSKIGVNHVMRLFKKHFFENPDSDQLDYDKSNFSLDLDMNQKDVQCDEEVILNAIKKAGFNGD